MKYRGKRIIQTVLTLKYVDYFLDFEFDMGKEPDIMLWFLHHDLIMDLRGL